MQAAWWLSDLDSVRLIPPESEMTPLFLSTALILEAPNYSKLVTSNYKIPLRAAVVTSRTMTAGQDYVNNTHCVLRKMAVFWDFKPFSLVDSDRRFIGAYCLHFCPDDGGSKLL
jgi:hypothetical protein